MVLEGGVAGAQPLHKGGPKARPPQYQARERGGKCETPSLASLVVELGLKIGLRALENDGSIA